MKEISAGGVVISNSNVLILKKFHGEWVLPKGRTEEGENLEETALREVEEETGIICDIERYIGYVRYNYKRFDGVKIEKTVHYFYMKRKSGLLEPQKEEGFKEACFVNSDMAIDRLKHYAEKNMVERAVEWYRQ